MHTSSYQGVVDQLVTLLVERRRFANGHREAYLSLARAILDSDSDQAWPMPCDAEGQRQTSPHSTRAA